MLQCLSRGGTYRLAKKMPEIPGLTLNSCVTLGRPLCLSLAQFPSLQNGEGDTVIALLHMGAERIK